MLKVLFAAVASAAMVGGAIAADLPRKEPPPVVAAPVGKAPIGKAPIGKLPFGKGPVVAIGYDEPEILPSSTRPICLMSADGGQFLVLNCTRSVRYYLSYSQ